MKEYYFKVWFSDNFVSYYPVTAPTLDVAIKEMLTFADCDAVESDTTICDYRLEYVYVGE